MAKQQERLFRHEINQAIAEEMRADPTVFCLGVGIAEWGGSFKVTEGLLEEFGHSRIIDTPMAEASITGVSVGAALTGMRPVLEILFVDFTLLILDQMVNQAAKANFMFGGNTPVPMVLRTQGGVGNGVAAQHSQSLEELYYHIPGLKLVAPATGRDARGLMRSAIRDADPVVYMEHKLLYPIPSNAQADEEIVIPLGKGDIKRPGKDVTIIAWSRMVHDALTAADELAKEGIDAEVVDLRSLVPMDKEMILESVKKTEHVVIAQEAVRRGGVASDIASIIQEEAFDYLDAPIEIVAGLNTPIPFNITLEQMCIPHVPDIVAAAKRSLFSSDDGGV
jgi:pyruvate/2-oxoglutarate/acetoin dehydrogenase E1 component